MPHRGGRGHGVTIEYDDEVHTDDRAPADLVLEQLKQLAASIDLLTSRLQTLQWDVDDLKRDVAAMKDK